MFKFDESEKDGRKAALVALRALMAKKTGEKLAGLKKKPAAMEVSVEKLGPEDDDEAAEGMDGMDAGELGESAGGEPSEEDKAKIAELYHRYCK